MIMRSGTLKEEYRGWQQAGKETDTIESISVEELARRKQEGIPLFIFWMFVERMNLKRAHIKVEVKMWNWIMSMTRLTRWTNIQLTTSLCGRLPQYDL